MTKTIVQKVKANKKKLILRNSSSKYIFTGKSDSELM